MMMSEFETLTGFHPTDDLYAEIEEAYYEFDGQKREFCAAYKANIDGLADTIRDRAHEAAAAKAREKEAEIARLNQQIEEQRKKIEMLKEELDREQEWKPWVDRDGIKQEAYDRLRKCGRMLSDEEAIDWIEQETGFQRARIAIIRAIPEYEVNRHHQLRKTGAMIDRSPVYDATDWHYMLFRVRANCDCYYELYNDELRPCDP